MTTQKYDSCGQSIELYLPREKDLFVFREVLGDIDQYQIKKLIAELSSEDLVIDAGAHIGLFSLAVAQKVKKVIAVEPNQENILAFNKHVSCNHLENITLIGKALSKKDGKKNLYNSLLSPARHSFFLNYFLNFQGVLAESASVDTISLTSLFKAFQIKRCNLLKMDIEGAEYEALFHTDLAIFKKIDRILLQAHTPIEKYTIEDLVSFLSEKGFLCTIYPPKTHHFGSYTLDEVLIDATKSSRCKKN